MVDKKKKTFFITKTEESLSIALCSNMENIDRVSDETKFFLESKGLSCIIFDVCLVLREGLSNAVRHAHHSDPQKMIHYILQVKGEDLVMEIEDQGEGFDWKTAIHHVAKENQGPLLEHGRGFKIMSEYVSEIKYNKKGNKLTLTKRIPHP